MQTELPIVTTPFSDNSTPQRLAILVAFNVINFSCLISRQGFVLKMVTPLVFIGSIRNFYSSTEFLYILRLGLDLQCRFLKNIAILVALEKLASFVVIILLSYFNLLV